jgi:hypothetical protein
MAGYPPEGRLVSHLQHQFREQVLEPVSGFVGPCVFMEAAAGGYLRALTDSLDRYWLSIASRPLHSTNTSNPSRQSGC